MATFDFNPAAIDAVFAHLDRSDRPGVAVGIAHRGMPLYRRGFGLASVEQPMVLSPSIRIRIGSVTKHFTCLAIMLLAERGLLSPDDSLRRHIPELKPWADQVTLRQVMSHTGGVRCSLELYAVAGDIMSRPLPHNAQRQMMRDLNSVDFAAGTDWRYSNGGYVLLTEVVERVGGRPFDEFLADHILKPVGLFDTFMRATDTDMLPNSATLHVPQAGGGYSRGVFGPDIGGEGGLVSTVDDMLRWLAHMDRPVVGTAQSWQAMMTPATLNDGRTVDYGFGLAIHDYRGQRVILHGGTVVGGGCQMAKLPDQALDIIVLGNASGLNPVGLTEQVIDALLHDLPPKPEAVDISIATGDYYAPDNGGYLRLVETDGKPGIEYTPAIVPLTGRADGSLWYQLNLTRGATILPDGDDAILCSEFSGPHRLPRALPPLADEGAVIAGRYRSPELALTANVTGGEVILDGLAGVVRMRLDPRAPGLWMLLSGTSGAVVAQLERDGDALLLSSLRIHRLRLERAPGRDQPA